MLHTVLIRACGLELWQDKPWKLVYNDMEGVNASDVETADGGEDAL